MAEGSGALRTSLIQAQAYGSTGAKERPADDVEKLFAGACRDLMCALLSGVPAASLCRKSKPFERESGSTDFPLESNQVI
jgi:hypothetical protein